MNDYRINTHYARALMMLAADRGETDRVADDMKLVGEVMTENRELRVVMANPTVPRDKKVGIMRAIFEGRVCEATMAFLLFAVRQNRAVNLRGMSEAYREQWRERNGVVLTDMLTHQPIDDSIRQTLTTMVEQYTGRHVELCERTDESMLGSFKLEFDGKMYDARLRTKIRRLKQEFAKNDYEKKL